MPLRRHPASAGRPEPEAAGADSVVVFISDGRVDGAELQVRLKERLPNYMAPREVLQVESFPLNSNGKVDRKALLEILEAE